MADDIAALAASVSVRDQQPEVFLVAHEALFRARHDDFIRLATYTEVRDVLSAVGVDVIALDDDLASGRPQKAMGESFHLYEKYEAFGVPTFLVDNDATFVRYMDPPNGDDHASRQLIESIISLIKGTPGLNEFKHTQVPN
jgi:protein-disulfide isomerase-like protein with CxxC motif